MDFSGYCRICVKENIDEPVFLTENLYNILEDDLGLKDVPRHHILIKLPTNVCFQCYCALVELKKFHNLCYNAEQFFKSKLELLDENEQETNNIFSDNNETTENFEFRVCINDLDNEEYVRNDVNCMEDNTAYLKNSGENKEKDYTVENYELLKKNCSSDTIEKGGIGSRLFVCKVCDIDFDQISELRAHETRHPGLRPYSCEVCGNAFKQRSALNTHLSLHYGKKVPCPICDKKFARKSFLIEHLRSHRGEKPFQCEQCGETFRLRRYLADHKKEHMDIENFICKFCKKSFKNRSNMMAHLKVHTQYICTICNQAYGKCSRLRIHIQKIHQIMDTEQHIRRTFKKM